MMNIPDFSIPSEDARLTVDKNKEQLKVGDYLVSNNIPLRGYNPVERKYGPVEEYEGSLIIRYAGSFLVSSYVRVHTSIIK